MSHLRKKESAIIGATLHGKRRAMKPKISLITLGVSDMNRSVRFYREGLGLPEYGNFPGAVFFKLSGTWLSLYPRDKLALDARVGPDGQGFSGITLAQNEPSKAEVDSVLKQAELAGAKITKPAEDAAWGGYSGYFSDPDGYLWEVAWNPHFDLT